MKTSDLGGLSEAFSFASQNCTLHFNLSKQLYFIFLQNASHNLAYLRFPLEFSQEPMSRHGGRDEPLVSGLAPHPEPPPHSRAQQHDHLALPHRQRVRLLTLVVTAHRQQGLPRGPPEPGRGRGAQVEPVEALLAAGAVGHAGAGAGPAAAAAAGPAAQLLRVGHVAGGLGEDVRRVLPARGRGRGVVGRGDYPWVVRGS